MTKDSGLAAFQRKMAAMPKAMRLAVAPAVEQSADEMVDMAKRLAPVDDGELRDGIAHGPGDHELARTVRANAFYAGWVEFGTLKSDPRPFFWPAYRLIRKRVKNRIRRAVGKAVKDFNNGQ